MTMIKDCSTATQPPSTTVSSSCFLGCFGCSGNKIHPRDKVNSGSRRRWFSKWKLSFKKSATNKTVPAEHTTTSRKSKSFQLSEKHAMETSNTTWEIQVVEEDATLTKKSVIMVATSDEKNIRLKKGTGILKHHYGSSRGRRKQTKAAAEDERAFSKRPPSAGGFDSLIGMSVILVTLLMMVLWGKLCAIICTAAWFFIAPRLVERSIEPTAKERRRDSHDNLDLESMEYKKKVILEGLLQRNHRDFAGKIVGL